MEQTQTITKSRVGLKLAVAVLAVVAAAAVITAGFYFLYDSSSTNKMVIGNQELQVEIVTNFEGMSQGLSGRESLAANGGMLFIYDNATIPGFWMKDMNFAIDIIWINDEMVVGFEKNVMPEDSDNLTVYRPSNFVDMVLEVNAGFVDYNSIRIGDGVEVFTAK